MHPIMSAEMKKARVADFHRAADRDRLARAARPGYRLHRAPERREPRPHPARLVLRVLAAIRAH